MINPRFSLLSLIMIVIGVSGLRAAAPNWTVNPSAFTYDLNITAILVDNCVELQNPSNKIGAFINGQLRGTVNTSTVVGGKFMALLSVYSNSPSGETITFQIYNATTDQIVNTKTTLLFQDDAVYGTPSVPQEIRTNNRPSSIALSGSSIQENLATASLIGSFTTSDADLTDTHTYSLVSGTGGGDNGSFSITGSQLLTNGTLDFEAKKTLSIRVRSTDNGGCSIENVFNIKVLDGNDSPTNIALAITQTDENKIKGSQISLITGTDQDSLELLTYTLPVGFGDNRYFAIVGTQLVADSVLDFEFKSTYNIRIRVTDAQSAFFEKNFVVSLNDINDNPTGVNISNSQLDENNKIGITIGNLSAIDQDAGDLHSYAFKDIPGNNNNKFFIVGNQLKASVVFDYESTADYFIYVSCFDKAGKEAYSLINIKITDANDAPTNVIISNTSALESKPVGTFIGKFATEDLDVSQTHVYTFASGVGDLDNASFQIKNDSLFSNAVYDILAKDKYSIRIQSDDQNGAAISKQFDILIKDVNNPPTDLFVDNLLVDELSKIGTVIGNFSALDADPGDGHTFVFVSGTGDSDNARFTISKGQLKSNTTFDFQTKSQYNIRVEGRDNFGGTFQKAFIVEVVNGNDKPTNITISKDSIAENMISGTEVAILSTTDKDIADVHTYTLVGTLNPDNSQFVINGNKLLSNASFDFESKKQYAILIKTDDGNGGTLEKQFVIRITNGNDAPTDVNLTNNSIAEEQPIGTVVGVFQSSDPDFIDNFTYSLAAGSGDTDNRLFTIVNDTLKSAQKFDLSVASSFNIRVQTSDKAGQRFQKSFKINITDVNDAPTGISLSNNSIPENNKLGDNVGLLSTADPDLQDVHTYSLVSGLGDNDNSVFLISGNSLKMNGIVDFETKDSLFIRVKTQDPTGAGFEKSFVIVVTNTNDNPTEINISKASFKENVAKGFTIGLLSTIDQDLNDNHSYSFEDLSGNNNDKFLLFGNNLRTNALFNYETQSDYIIAIRTTDPAGRFFVKQFAISVLDSNDTPISLSLNDSTVLEKSSIGSSIGQFSTLDADANDSFTYSLVSGNGGEDNRFFTLVNGELLTNTVFNFNTQNVYRILVRSTDAGGLFRNQKFTIYVDNLNVAATRVTFTSSEVKENQKIGTFVAKLTATDEDLGDVHSYSLVTGIGSSDNSSFDIRNDSLFTNDFFDFEVKDQYQIRVRCLDKASNPFDTAFTVSIADLNERPVADDMSFLLDESAKSGTELGVVTFVDQDKSQSATFSLLGDSKIKQMFTIESTTGKVSFLQGTLDYEKTGQLELKVLITDNGTPKLSDTSTVTVSIVDAIENALPSSDYLSPNGDGRNDAWKVTNVEMYKDYSLNIFDSFGTLVYNVSSNYDNTWEGTYQGSQLPAGTYYYVFKATADSNKSFTGTITLVR